MKEIIMNILEENKKYQNMLIEDALKQILELNKNKTYKELINEINQCRFHAGSTHAINDLISGITEIALSKVIQS